MNTLFMNNYLTFSKKEIYFKYGDFNLLYFSSAITIISVFECVIITDQVKSKTWWSYLW